MGKQALPEQLNICIIANKFPILGRAAEHGFLWPIARRMAALGHNIIVLASKSPQKKAEIVQDNVHIYYLGEGVGAQMDFQDAAKATFSKLHKANPFHLVHSIDSSGFKIARNKKEYGVAVAYDVEATQMHQIFSIMGMAQETLGSLISTSLAVAYKYLRTFYGRDRALLNTADGVFVTSPQQKVALERYYLYPEFKTYTVPFGIEIGDLSPREMSEELRKKYDIPLGTKIVATVTDMSEFGEVSNLLRAFQIVATKKPHSRLLIVGNGPLFKKIEYDMLTLALGNKVIFAGAVKNTEIPDYISLSDVYVNLSSRTTGFEPSILEAMAQEKVIIGSEVSPISGIVEDGFDGFLIRPADIQSLSTLLIEIFAGNLPASEIGQRARKKVIDLFDTEKLVKETIAAYYKILINTNRYKKPKTK